MLTSGVLHCYRITVLSAIFNWGYIQQTDYETRRLEAESVCLDVKAWKRKIPMKRKTPQPQFPKPQKKQ